MPTATLLLAPRAEHVRTARLVSGAAARRAGVAEGQVDDVRLCVSEAMGQAIRRSPSDEGVEVELLLTDAPDRFSISISDGRAIDPSDEEAALSYVLIRTLAPQAAVEDDEAGDRLVLTWPTPR